MTELSNGEMQPGHEWKNCMDILVFFFLTLPIKEGKRCNCEINVSKFKKKKKPL